MSDSYEALVDCAATLADAERLANEVVEVLSSAGLILPTPNADCVLDGTGHPAGPRRFITSRGGFIALESIQDYVRSLASAPQELQRYLRSESAG